MQYARVNAPVVFRKKEEAFIVTMIQKIHSKKNKKGFTLVELVIVIAILAILAAIAIPVITTTINAAKLSGMESDCTSVNMLLKEAVNCSKVFLKSTKWNGKSYFQATVKDVLDEANIDCSEDFFIRTIGGVEYSMVWTDGYNLEMSGGDLPAVNGFVLTGDEDISSLDPT